MNPLKGVNRFRDQKKGGASAGAGKQIETGESDVKRFNLSARPGHQRYELGGEGVRPKGVQEGDVRHPAAIVAVVLPAQSLNRPP